MVVIKVPQEIKIAGCSPSRIFKAMALEPYTIVPRALPTKVKSVEVVEGNGGPGSIVKTTLSEGTSVVSLKYKVISLDPAAWTTKYTVIEGPTLGDKLESITYDVKVQESGDGGSIVEITNEFHTKGNAQLKEEEIKASTERDSAFYIVTGEYLVAHPDVCA